MAGEVSAPSGVGLSRGVAVEGGVGNSVAPGGWGGTEGGRWCSETGDVGLAGTTFSGCSAWERLQWEEGTDTSSEVPAR